MSSLGPCQMPLLSGTVQELLYNDAADIFDLVAQLDRALGFEPRGRGFESLRGHHAGENNKCPSVWRGFWEVAAMDYFLF